MIKSHYLAILGIIINGVCAHDQHLQHPPDELYKGSSPIFKDPMSSGQDPPPEIPGIQDYPNPNDRILLNSMTSSDPNNDSPASPLDSNRLSNSPIIRKTRAASTNSQEFLDHISIIARIANGISLQAGLMNNVTKIEEVAGELLSFGDISVSTIAKFKPDSLNKFTTKLKEAPTVLDSSIMDQEQQVLDLTELLKKSKTIGDLKDLSGKDAYFSYLKDLLNFDDGPLRAPSFSMKQAMERIDSIDKAIRNEDAIASDASFVASAFGSLGTHLNGMSQKIEAFKTSLQTLKDSELKNGPTVIGPLKKMIDLIYFRVEYKTPLSNQDVAKSNLNKVLMLSADSEAAVQDVATVTSLARSRSNTGFQKRKITSGFPNGVSDLKQLVRDVRNPWIGKILGTNESVDSLNDGLLPLFKMNKKLADLDEKLAVLSTPKLSKTLSGIRGFQKELSKVDQNVADITETVWKELHLCRKEAYPIDSGDLKDIKAVIKDVTILYQISQFELEVNVDDLNKEIKRFNDSLKFSDVSNIKQSMAELPGVMKTLKESGSLQKINTTLSELLVIFEGSHVSELKKKAGDVVSKEGNMYDSVFDKEVKLYACLENVKDAEKVVQAIAATRKLRGLKSDDVAPVESSIKAVSGVSKDLSNLKSLTTEMQKHPDVAPTDLNKFPNSTNQSKVIGQSAASLRFAHGLKELDPEIADLKDVDAIVQAEILKVSDPAQINDLTAQWGDHQSHMDSLDQTLSGIRSFDSNLNVSKAETLEELSSPLKNLGSIPNAKINALEKSKVLEVLIAQPQIDPSVKSDLKKSKQTLDKLAPLDLGFSSHKSQFEKAPDAFKALHDFLVGFFTVQRNNMASSANNGSSIVSGPAEEPDNTIMWIIIGVAAFLLVGVSIGVGVWVFISRRKKKQEDEERLEEEERDRLRREKEKEDRDKERKERDAKEAAMEEEKKELEAQKKREHDAREQEEARRKAAEDERRAASKRRRAAEAEAAAERKKRETMAKDQKAKDQAQQVKDREQFEIDMRTMLLGVEKWIRNHKYQNASQMVGILGDQMKIVVNYQKQNNKDLIKSSLIYLPREKHRYPNAIPCHLETVVKFQFNGVDIKIHANHVVTKPTYSKSSKFGDVKVSMRFIATQGPLKNTLDDFWSMVWHFKVEFIIMLCLFKEDGKVKCDTYFKADATGTFETELFKIDTVDFEPMFKGREAGWKRKFEVTLKKDPKGEKRTLTHYHYLEWPDKGVPNGHEDVSQLLEFVKDSKAPVVVHCSAGIGRTMCLIGTEYMAAEVKHNANYTVAQGGIDLRNVRCNGIQTFEQMVWLVASVVYRLTHKFGLESEDYDALVKQIKTAQKMIFMKDLELKLKRTIDFREGDMDEDLLKRAIEKEREDEKKMEDKKQRTESGKDTRIVMDVEEDGEEVAGPGVEVIEMDSDEEEES